MDDLDGLDRYASAIAELALWLREEGHILSSMDQHWIERWFDAGYPLGAVLEEIRRTGTRLKKRKSPPRGLPLSSMKAAVARAGERARLRAVGGAAVDAPPEPQALTGIEPVVLDLEAALTAETDPERRRALQDARSSIERVDEMEGPFEVFSLLLAASRCYYDDRVGALSAAQRSALRDAVMVDLGEAAAAMDADALEQTVAELIRRRLREQDPVLHPDRLEAALP